MITGSLRRRAVAAGALVLTGALALSACGDDSGDSNDSGASNTSVDSKLAAMVPAAIKSDGKITIGTDASYPPNESVDPASQKIVGWDVELFDAVAAKLGLKTQYSNAGFDTIIPGVQSGKYEAGVSSFTDTKEREGAVDFVTYYSAGTSWAALKGNPKGVNPDDACGKSIGVQQGTVQVDDLKARSKKCTDAGKPAIKAVVRKQQTEVNNDLVAGKVDGMAADSPIVGDAVKKTGGKLQILGQVYDTAPYGYAIGKNSGQFKEALQGALKALIADGTYKKILTDAGVESGAITEPAINAAQS
ncbi:ABC transporter substrate-binding protein [Actinomadura madurae]|uniref:ABC transporter substrate-binding protein n=1 Tax=Actinomadura madurae TaxID=1993 RepID=UPI002026EC53|nr:ABC transporter substrate-binding protein [Actinomadura madurae]MCP9954146.1 ABC transporter substrate-binding protein [Actinomadura madurae]MCP9970895.1 ABC transporter substrate-binding protein [Actinomadura madurae]MCP9983371.1 ABC transporter substrate-binding protein [Actinomadura madurae]MCQ0005066.1 ABC transporter substrate-binding protein [Actinomadura madurae]MCQ0019622.1 ABC transporter substrate-binding protein [Actinomadura madurae]